MTPEKAMGIWAVIASVVVVSGAMWASYNVGLHNRKFDLKYDIAIPGASDCTIKQDTYPPLPVTFSLSISDKDGNQASMTPECGLTYNGKADKLLEAAMRWIVSEENQKRAARKALEH